MQLVIGNKNYSSWSMRPWVLMRQAGIAFTEVRLRFDDAPAADSPFQRELAHYSPAGKVPVLIDPDVGDDTPVDAIGPSVRGPLAVWDTLAIAEYLAEKFPQRRLWPDAPRERARARSVCAEMHAGFTALRTHCPMNVEARLPEVGARVMAEREDLRADLARLVALWDALLGAHGGPLLFGRFTIADAYFAPVCSRIRTYALPVPQEVQAYADEVLALPAVQAWDEDALAERDFLDFEEPYRSGR
jgi:glutathione S-transferase